MPRNSTRVGDPARLLTLLWKPSAQQGRSGLTLEAITTTAVSLADAEGLAAVTMRRIADDLGAGAMSLYGYLPGKPELVELMLDAVWGRVYDVGDRPGDQPDWRIGLRKVATQNWRHLLAHPWISEVTPGRPVTGPGASHKYEDELAPLDGIGLDDVRMDLVLASLLALVESSARTQIGLDRIRAETGQSDAAWWEQMAPLFAAATAGHELALSARVGTAAGTEFQSYGAPEAQLNLGVDLLIRGLDELISGRDEADRPPEH